MPTPVKAKIREPNRSQSAMRFEAPEDLVPPNHPVRLIDGVIGRLDLNAFTDDSTSRDGSVGRSTLSPHMKLTLWLYAVARGISSSREISRRTLTEDAFRWIVGDLAVSHDTLSAFLVGHREALQLVMTDILGILVHQGLLSLETVALDGTRVRASASSPSFRSRASLEACREQAALHVKAVLADADNPDYTAQQHAARKAGAEGYQKRVAAAITEVDALQAQRAKAEELRRRNSVVRASTTDAEARVMKMGDSGFRPAYNVQIAVAGSSLGGPRTIVGVAVTNLGSDVGSVGPMIDQIKRRTGKLPGEVLADGQHASYRDLEAAAERDVVLLTPVPDSASKTLETLPPVVRAWRERMETETAAERYRARPGLVELVNAHVKGRFGVEQFLVRGLEKVTCFAVMTAITFNVLQHATRLLG